MKKILLVDDSRTVRMLGGRIVRQLGHETLEAGDGAEALEIARQHPDLDAVLLDWNMPVMDGITFLRTLRADAREKQPVVVMCTTENEMERIVEALTAGADEYVMKPFSEDIVKEKLELTGVL